MPSTAAQRRARDLYLARRRGLDLGVPPGAYGRALAQMRRMEGTQRGSDKAAALATPGVKWKFIGPEPILNEVPDFGGPISGATFNSGGRVSAIAADPTTPGRVFVGAASGGLWMSSDGGATFKPIGDSLPTQAIGAIALDTVNTHPPTIYLATGEANNSIDSYYGRGIFKSRDLGKTWVALSPGAFDNASFAKLAIDASRNPPTLFAAAGLGVSAGRADPDFVETDLTDTGLWRSTDGGAQWMHYPAKTFGCGLAPAPRRQPCPAQDVAIDPTDPKKVYVAIEFDNVFRSTDGGNNWTPACFTNDAPCSFPRGLNQMFRQSIAIAPSDPRTVYVMVGAIDGAEYIALFKSSDSGVSWSTQSVPSWRNPDGLTIDGIDPGNASQSFYDQTLLVSPKDFGGNTVLFGGLGIYESTDSGADWAFLARNGGTHTDQHALSIAPDNDTVYIGNDGGVFKFSLSGIAEGVASFTSLNDTVGNGQVQAVAPHPFNDATLLAGFQDNGTQLFGGALGWTSVDVGDGGFTLFDRVDPDFAYHTYSTVDGEPALARSIDGGLSWHFADPTNSIAAEMAGAGDRGAVFYPPLAADPAVPGRVLFGAHFVYVSTDGMLSWQRQETTDLAPGCISGDCALQDIEFAPSDHRKAWALSTRTNRTGFRIHNTAQADLASGALWKDVTARLLFNSAGTQATGLAVDPGNPNIAYLSVSGFSASTRIGHVFKTTDFGVSWREADGAGWSAPLPDVPVLRILVDNADSSGRTLYAATDIGVFRTLDGGVTWRPFNLGSLPAVPVFDIQQNRNGVIFIGTHGRGVWQIQVPRSGAGPVRIKNG